MKPSAPFDPNQTNYLIGEDLKAAVDVALELGMPLLVTGEPGTGKTRLARYVAEEMLNAELLVFNTKTSSKARDLLYQYNALTHFRDSQAGKPDLNPMNYIRFQALGKAIVRAKQQRYVILVDEIDKAPRDFPNDVLFEFEQLAFQIEEAQPGEIQRWVDQRELDLAVDDQAFLHYQGDRGQRPVLILTSNSEKNLPDAFLRRCAYYHIPFPEKDRLLEIVEANVPLSESFTQQMLQDAVDHFIEIRDLSLRKNPATAELLAWIHLLKKEGLDVKSGLNGSEDDIRQKIKQSYTVLTKNKEDRDRVLAEWK